MPLGAPSKQDRTKVAFNPVCCTALAPGGPMSSMQPRVERRAFHLDEAAAVLADLAHAAFQGDTLGHRTFHDGVLAHACRVGTPGVPAARGWAAPA
jgi:hypothetical protein